MIGLLAESITVVKEKGERLRRDPVTKCAPILQFRDEEVCSLPVEAV